MDNITKELERRIKELEDKVNKSDKKESPRYLFPGFQHHA